MAFGTITLILLNVSTSVARILICLTLPSSPSILTQSPTFIGRSNNKIIPDTKLFTIFCNPKPIPTESALAIKAKLPKLPPIINTANIAAITKFMKLMPEANECFIPSSISIWFKTLLTIRFFIILPIVKAPKNTAMPKIMATTDISTSPTLKPNNSFLKLCNNKSVDTPHNDNKANMPTKINIGLTHKVNQKLILSINLRRNFKFLTQNCISKIWCRNSMTAL